MEKFTIYTDIDTLFDTRLSTIASISPAIASEILIGGIGKYISRQTNNFDGMPENLFEQVYATRGIDIFRNSTATNVMSLLFNIHTETMKSFADIVPKMIINTYPYEFEMVDIRNVIAGLRTYVPVEDIKFIYKSNKELTPAYIDKEVGLMVKYDGLEWIETQLGTKKLLKTYIGDILMYIPNIMFRTTKKRIVKKEFDDVIRVISKFIDLEVIDPINFCTIVSAQMQKK